MYLIKAKIECFRCQQTYEAKQPIPSDSWDQRVESFRAMHDKCFGEQQLPSGEEPVDGDDMTVSLNGGPEVKMSKFRKAVRGEG